jgi:twinkle protein
MIINGFEIEKYNQYGFSDMSKTDICPKCSHERKKKTDKCVKLDWEKGFANCFHCGESFQLHTYKSNKKEVKYEIPIFKYDKLDEKVVLWFKNRGISQQTLAHAKVTQSKEWMPQTKKEGNTINFNYFLNDEIVNIKYRDAKKNFKLYKGAEKILYNLDSIRTSLECVIVEGEIDCLSFIESGYYNVVSVPNGFNLQGVLNLDYLDNYTNYFDNKERIYLCLDNDEAGQKGKDEFIRRLGSDKCFIVDLKDCKDANEYLIKYGNESLLERLEKAELTPLENVKTLNDFTDELDSFWINGLPKGMLTGMNLFDEVFSAEMGQYTLITGVPQSGKSEFLDQMIVRYNLNTGNKVGFVSIENEPFIFHYDKIAQKLFGRKPKQIDIGTDELKEVKEYINNNYYHVHFEKRYFLEEVLMKFRELVKRKGIRIFAIDPFNKVKLKKGISNINDFTSEYHLLLDEFVKETKSHLFLVAHPTKTLPAEGSQSSFQMPTAYDIKGGGEHFDMSYNVIGVNRVYEQKIVHIKTLKVKFRHLGEQQKSVFYSYNTINGRYEDLEYQPEHIDFETVINSKGLDCGNWLRKEIKQPIEENNFVSMPINDNFDNEFPEQTDQLPF